MATNAFGAWVKEWRGDTGLCAIDKEHAELKVWLPGPPVALFVLAAELVTPLGILSFFEVNGIFLKQKACSIKIEIAHFHFEGMMAVTNNSQNVLSAN